MDRVHDYFEGVSIYGKCNAVLKSLIYQKQYFKSHSFIKILSFKYSPGNLNKLPQMFDILVCRRVRLANKLRSVLNTRTS